MDINRDFIGIPYWVGAIFLGILNTGLFYLSSKPWGITSAMSFWGAEMVKLFGASPERWMFFTELKLLSKVGDYQPFLYGSMLNFGLILGAFAAALIHKEFRIRWPRRGKQYFAALLGGLLMGTAPAWLVDAV